MSETPANLISPGLPLLSLSLFLAAAEVGGSCTEVHPAPALEIRTEAVQERALVTWVGLGAWLPNPEEIYRFSWVGREEDGSEFHPSSSTE